MVRWSDEGMDRSSCQNRYINPFQEAENRQRHAACRSFLILFLIALYLYGIFWFSRKLFRKWHDWHWRQRLGFGAIALAVIASLSGAQNRGLFLGSVQSASTASRICYRVQSRKGLGVWAWRKRDRIRGLQTWRIERYVGHRLGKNLGAALGGENLGWLETPVDDRVKNGRKWHSYVDHPATGGAADIRSYLDQYGFGLPLENDRADAFNLVIRTPDPSTQGGRSHNGSRSQAW
jgi:hypothetical protein